MKIKFLGAAGTVTGSSYVLTSDSGQSILIDLGMFQGTEEIDRLNYETYEYDCNRLSGAVLTHAHLDHCGRLPILLSKGFKGNIWMNSPTRDLTELSLLDSAKIAKYGEKKALYDKSLALKTFSRFKTMEYHSAVPIGDFSVMMKDAGHILGSSSLEIVDNKAKSEIKKIVFSGDLGNSPEPLVKETETFEEADAVVMESTYGDRLHPSEDPKEVVQAEINAVEGSGGILLIPAFSLERTQELLHMIMHMKSDGKIKYGTPIFMDSPMAQSATSIYTDYPELFNPHAEHEIRTGKAFDFPGFALGSGENLGTKVIIAGSGMMSGGKILKHAQVYLPLASTRLLIVGYQGEGTLGREILEGKRNVIISGKNVQIKATVNSTQAMSSHADQKQLLEWLKVIKNVKKVFLTHGEDEPRNVLAKEVREKVGISNIVLPNLNEEITV